MKVDRPSAVWRGRKVLVIEDHADSREITRLQLVQLGVTVAVAANGAEGLEIAKRTSPDLVVCDLMMPRMDGFEFMRHVQDDPHLRTIRVLALSVLGSPEALLQTWQAGFIGHLVKPIAPEALEAQLRRIFWAHDSN